MSQLESFFLRLRKLTQFENSGTSFVTKYGFLTGVDKSGLNSLDTTLSNSTPSLGVDTNVGQIVLPDNTTILTMAQLEHYLLFVEEDALQNILKMTDDDITALYYTNQTSFGIKVTAVETLFKQYKAIGFYDYFEIDTNDYKVTFDHFRYLMIQRLGFGDLYKATQRLNQIFTNLNSAQPPNVLYQGLLAQIDTTLPGFNNQCLALYKAIQVMTGVFIGNDVTRFKLYNQTCNIVCDSTLPYDTSQFNPTSITTILASLSWSPYSLITLALANPSLATDFTNATGLPVQYAIINQNFNNYNIDRFIYNKPVTFVTFPVEATTCSRTPNSKFIMWNDDPALLTNGNYINLGRVNKDDAPIVNTFLDTLPITIANDFSLLKVLSDLGKTNNVNVFNNILPEPSPDSFTAFMQTFRHCSKFVDTAAQPIIESNGGKFVKPVDFPSLNNFISNNMLGWDVTFNLPFFVQANNAVISLNEIESIILNVDEIKLKTILNFTTQEIQLLKSTKTECLPGYKEKEIKYKFSQYSLNYKGYEINDNCATLQDFQQQMTKQLGQNNENIATVRLQQIFKNIDIFNNGFLANIPIPASNSYADQCAAMYDGLRRMLGVYFLNSDYKCKPLELTQNHACEPLPIANNSPVMQSSILWSPALLMLAAQNDAGIAAQLLDETGLTPDLNLLNVDTNNAKVYNFIVSNKFNLLDKPMPVKTTIPNSFLMSSIDWQKIKDITYVNLANANTADTFMQFGELKYIPIVVTRQCSWLLMLADIAYANSIDVFAGITPIIPPPPPPPPPPIIPDVLTPATNVVATWTILAILFIIIFLVISITIAVIIIKPNFISS